MATLKLGVGVVESDWKWRRSIVHIIRLSIGRPL